MPIVFEQPQPLSPSTSAAFGAASQYNRLAPTIASMAEAAGRQRLGAYGIAMGSFDRAMDRTFQSDEFSKNLQFQADRSVLEAQTHLNSAAIQGEMRMRAQAQQAELEQWQKSQDITQKEVLRLQHLQSGLGEIDQAEASGVLTQQEAAEARYAIRTPIEQLKARQMMTEQRHMDAQTASLREQTKRTSILAQEAAEFDSKTAQQRLAEVVNPVARKQVEMEFVAAGLGMHPNFDALVDAETRKRPGGVEHWLQIAPGKYERVFEGGKQDKGAKEKPFSETAAATDALAEAELAFPDDVTKDGKAYASPEQLRKRNEYATKVFERKRAEAGGPPPSVKPTGNTATSDSPVATGNTATSDSPVAKTGPLAERIQKAPQEIVMQQLMELGQRNDIPEPIKQQAAFALQTAANMVEKAGGYDKLSDQEKKLFDQYQRAYKTIVMQTAPPTVPPPPARPRTDRGGSGSMSEPPRRN